MSLRSSHPRAQNLPTAETGPASRTGTPSWPSSCTSCRPRALGDRIGRLFNSGATPHEKPSKAQAIIKLIAPRLSGTELANSHQLEQHFLREDFKYWGRGIPGFYSNVAYLLTASRRICQSGLGTTPCQPTPTPVSLYLTRALAKPGKLRRSSSFPELGSWQRGERNLTLIIEVGRPQFERRQTNKRASYNLSMTCPCRLPSHIVLVQSSGSLPNADEMQRQEPGEDEMHGQDRGCFIQLYPSGVWALTCLATAALCSKRERGLQGAS